MQSKPRGRSFCYVVAPLLLFNTLIILNITFKANNEEFTKEYIDWKRVSRLFYFW